MNERLIELYKEAAEFAYSVCRKEGRIGGPSDHIWHTLSTGRFAELIVKECAEVAQDFVTVENNKLVEHVHISPWKLQDTIKEYFGIE